MSLEAAYRHCSEAARAFDRDRWLGALFAPPPARGGLHALIAFEAEMSHLRAAVRDPRMGEIRLAWWREALTGERPGEAGANPVAAALLDTLTHAAAPPHLIANAISGRQFDLYDDQPATIGDLEGYLGETRSGLLQIGAHVLGEASRAAEASGLGGVALGLTELLRSLASPRPLAFVPKQMARFDLPTQPPRPELLAVVEQLIAHAEKRHAEADAVVRLLPPALAPAYAALATAPLWLKALRRANMMVYSRPVEVAAWRRQWALWRWMRRR